MVRAIAARLPIDWTTVESSASDESLRTAIRELKVIAEIAELHHTLPGATPSSSLRSSTGASSAGSVAAVAESAPAAETWGPLALLDRVARGSYGEVYRAWDSRLDREVALKLLRRHDAPHDSVGSAVIEEARLLARVRHPNVVTVYGADRIDGCVGLWMEFVQGWTLERVLRDHGPLGAHEAALIGLDLCRALSAVHRAGLVHRDVKAQNVMREAGGRIVLMDFGAGREREELADERAPDLAGTPLYLAPELFEHAQADARADIYSVGVLLYHLVTGAYPVKGSAFRDVRDAHRQGRRTLLRDERPDLPDRFVSVVERALDPDPMRRFESTGAMEAALSAALTTDGETTPVPDRDGLKTVPYTAGDYTVAGWTSRVAAVLPSRLRRPSLFLAGFVAAAAVAVALNVGGVRDRLLGRPGQPNQPDAAGPQVGVGQSSFSVRQVLIPGQYIWLGRPSLDGRYYPFVNSDGNLAVKEIATGTVRALTARGKSAESAVVESTISPDGKSVAYSWEALDRVVEMRIIGIDGAWPRVLVRRADVDVPHAIEWSTDGTELLSLFEMKNSTYQMALVAASDGTVRTLKDFGVMRPLRVSLSPDGRFVVYDRPQQANRSMRDIFVLATDGSGDWPLVEHPANDLFPQWSPDGDRLLFASDRTGALGLWMIRVAEGRALGDPEVISRDMGHMSPLGLTQDGAFYYRFETGLVDVYTVSVDPSTGTVTGKPQPVSPNYIGSNISSGWSPDGRRLAYVSIRSPAGSDRFSRALSIRDMDTSEERDLWPPLAFFMGPRWSPDGRTILVSGVDLKQRSGFQQIDVETGRVTPGILQERVPDGEGISQHRWTVDGKAIMHVRGDHLLMSRDLATGAETTLLDIRSLGVDRFTPGLNGNPAFELSPDGRSLAFSGWTGAGEEARSVLNVLPLGFTAPEVLRAPEALFFQGWTPDGLDLLFARPLSREERPNMPLALWRIPAVGGEPRRVGLEMVGLRDVHVGPDGTRLTFTAGWQTGDVRVMENFLPHR